MGRKMNPCSQRLARDALGPVAQCGGPAPGKDEQQDEDRPRSAAEGENGADTGEDNGFGEQRRRQGIHLCLRGCWPHGHCLLGGCRGPRGLLGAGGSCEGEEAGEEENAGHHSSGHWNSYPIYR